MVSLSFRVFLRTLLKSRELFALQMVTLSVAFACAIVIIIFSLNEFGYDRHHADAGSTFRLLLRNNNESFQRNRLSNAIGEADFQRVKSQLSGKGTVARVKIMKELTIIAGNNRFQDQRVHAADSSFFNVLPFSTQQGKSDGFFLQNTEAAVSAATAKQWFKDESPFGQIIVILSPADTLTFRVTAVFSDFPSNSHEPFNIIIPFDAGRLSALGFNAARSSVYGRVSTVSLQELQSAISKSSSIKAHSLSLQPLPGIYFGPRVEGEDTRHGDRYSIIILISLAALIFFLALTTFINLTSLALPGRSKEIAMKKIAGYGQFSLTLGFVKEFLFLSVSSLVLGVAILYVCNDYVTRILAIDIFSALIHGDLMAVCAVLALVLAVTATAAGLTLSYTKATPVRLLSTDKITFPRLKATIGCVQLGIGILLIAASLVIKRQINYSLLKEPGKNHDQIVYVSYPRSLTDEGLFNLRASWKKQNPSIVDIFATSHLPDHISSKELHSRFFRISVDPGFRDFFDLDMIAGRWFNPNDDDTVFVTNEAGKFAGAEEDSALIGVIEDMAEQFNVPQKPLKIQRTSHLNYNFLCIRILEVDIRKSLSSLRRNHPDLVANGPIAFLDKSFEGWLHYQDRLNFLSSILAIISAVLSCAAVYGLTLGLVRDKVKQIALHKMYGAGPLHITWLLSVEFGRQLLLAIIFFVPLLYIGLSELLRTFVYATKVTWLDPLLPIGFSVCVIVGVCAVHALRLNRSNLTSALKDQG